MPRHSQILKHESIVSNTVPISNKFRGILKPLSGSRIFIELPEILYLWLLFITVKNTNFASIQRKKHIKQSLVGFQTWNLHSAFLEMPCNNGQRFCQTRKHNQDSVSIVSTVAVIHTYHWLIAHTAEPVSRSIDTTRAKAATLGHTVDLYSGDSPHPQATGYRWPDPNSNVASPHLKQRCSYQVLNRYLRNQAQKQDISLSKAKFFTTQWILNDYFTPRCEVKENK